MSAAAHQRITTLAADRQVHRAFGWLHLHELQMLQWQLQIIGTPAPPFGEEARAMWVLGKFRELGLDEPRVDEEGNVLGSITGTNASCCVLLSAHVDTVFPAGTDCTPVVEDSRILAPGACDNAAGLTALLGLASALRTAQILPPCSILFCANVGEEGEGDLRGMKQLFLSDQPASIVAAIVLEGSGTATVVDRALGGRRFRITVEGPGGHSWADASQPNPIFALSEAIAALSRLELPSTPRTTLHCGTIAGGTSVNSVPESATATLDLRSVSPEQLERSAAEVVSRLETVLQTVNLRIPPRTPLAWKIDTIGDRPAAALSPTSALMTSLHAVDRHLRIVTEPRIGSTDANLPLSLGVPALAMGTGGTAGGIHTLHEWYDPTGRELALRRIVLHLLDVCALAATEQLHSNP